MMHRQSSLALLCVAAVLMSACGDSTPTETQSLTIASTFGAVGSDPGAADLASVSAGAAAGTIHVTGTMKLPAPCYDLSARVTPSNVYVTVDVTAERRLAGCTAQVSQVSYDLMVSGASTGSHTVVVRNTVEAGTSTTVTDAALTTVTVK